MKYILQRLCFKIALSIGIIALLTNMVEPVYAIPAETFQVLSEKTTLSQRMAEVRELYRQAGLEEYFKDVAFLWSESDKTRATLRPAIVQVNVEQARRMGMVLWEIFQRYPADPEVLVMAGRYHEATGQKDTARQLYRRALQVAPGYEPAYLGLADGYLSESNPEQALKLLEGLDSPETWLRKGIAHLAQGRYPLAVGYLIRAGIKPGPLEEVRVKDLAKAYRAVGSLAQVKQWLGKAVPTSGIGQVLVQDIAISVAIMERRYDEAMVQVQSAQTIVPEFHYWNFYSAWLQLLNGSVPEIGPMDVQLRSVIEIRQGQLLNKQGKTEEASQVFNNALKADKRSLIGYLEAGTWQWKRQNYNTALKLFSKGLELNPSFIPLLTKRAEIYEHLNQGAKAAADRAAIRLAWEQQPSFAVSQIWNESGTVYLNLSHDVGKVLGLWFSEDGSNWSFTPWGRITPRRNATHVWVVPVGPGISGSAVRVKLVKPAGLREVPAVYDEHFELHLPVKGQVVAEQIGNGTAGASFVSERIQEKQRIPLTPFGSNRQRLRVWYQVRGEVWQTEIFQLNLPEKPKVEEVLKPQLDVGLLMKTPVMPSVFDFSYRSNGEGYQLKWRSESEYKSRIRILTADGKWREFAVQSDKSGVFTANVPEESRFCQLIMVDEVGHTVVYTDPVFNELLMTNNPVRFRVNGGRSVASSRQVVISPEHRGLLWSISNDFRIWSQWFEGDTGSIWRIGAEPGRQVIFIRYQFSEGTGEASGIHYCAVFVDYRPE
ncbi:MAG TPA: tetratricopeptide repeat protein [Bacillota bacterium]|mgnify:FL=1|nr:tetratricopeptide repeat protein [Bacillota bacterium]HPT88183.1 tetratricopeptide repeat protein [Bacillota bacterium]